MVKKLSSKHLLGIKDLSADDINLIFSQADEFKEVLSRPIKKVPSLRDITVANLFFENSTRTRLSFELAEKRLSADVVNFSASSSSLKKGETLIDTVNNILAMKVDMLVMRHAAPGAAIFLSKHIDASIINAGDGTHEHPTRFGLKQALKNILVKPKSKSYEYGAYIRGKAVERLLRNNKIKCDFIIRDDFWASQSTGLKETRKEYANNMLNNPYALVTRGAGNFSYRFYEVFSCGRIPVFINTDSVLPFEEFINWKDHMVWVNDTDINSIGEILLDFHNKISPEAFIELQIRNRKII